jgi:hypothetical protein
LSAPLIVSEYQQQLAMSALNLVSTDLRMEMVNSKPPQDVWRRWVERVRAALLKWLLQSTQITVVSDFQKHADVARVAIGVSWQPATYIAAPPTTSMNFGDPSANMDTTVETVDWRGWQMGNTIVLSNLGMRYPSDWRPLLGESAQRIAPKPRVPMIPVWDMKMSNSQFAKRQRMLRQRRKEQRGE